HSTQQETNNTITSSTKSIRQLSEFVRGSSRSPRTPFSDLADDEKIFNGGDEEWQSQKQTQDLTEFSEEDLDQIRQKEEAVKQIESDMIDVNQIMKDLASIVYEQGDTIERRNLRMACAPRKRKEKFSPLELEILVAEVTKNHSRLYGSERVNLSQPARERIWLEIAKKINTVARSPRTTRDLRRRWDDMKRRTKEKLAIIRRTVVTTNRRCSPSSLQNDTNSDIYPGFGGDEEDEDHDEIDVDTDAPLIALELQSDEEENGPGCTWVPLKTIEMPVTTEPEMSDHPVIIQTSASSPSPPSSPHAHLKSTFMSRLAQSTQHPRRKHDVSEFEKQLMESQLQQNSLLSSWYQQQSSLLVQQNLILENLVEQSRRLADNVEMLNQTLEKMADNNHFHRETVHYVQERTKGSSSRVPPRMPTGESGGQAGIEVFSGMILKVEEEM
ncbi:hypothetical protein XELAEV_18032423mg, partial [Xenopus laevis]